MLAKKMTGQEVSRTRPAKSGMGYPRALLGAHAGTPGLTMVNAVGSARLPKNEKGAPPSGKDAPWMPGPGSEGAASGRFASACGW
jgi:hypothetical protein